MSDSRLNYLFGKYFDKTASAEEREEFMQCILNMHSDDSLCKLMEQAYNSNEQIFSELSPEVRSRILNNVFNAKAEIDQVPLQKQKTIKLSWVKYAAAVLIAMIGLGIFLYKNENQRNEITRTVNNYKNNIMAGGNKAILILGNGKKIVLDSASNGVLANQGNISISKTQSGQIVYNVKGAEYGVASTNSIETPVGGQYQVNLPDGTKVWLNASSSIKFPTVFAANERRVELTGEAYFEVAKNAKKPFKVNLNKDLDIMVLGTHFNINAYTNQNTINTTLLEGSVVVKSINKTQYITPGQQAQFDKKSAGVSVSDHVDVNQIIAWKNGYFSNESISLVDLMNEVERWYGVKVVYKDNVQADFVAKIPRNISLMELIELLELTKLVKFKLNQNVLTVMK